MTLASGGVAHNAGQREPAHIILLYPAFIYTAHIAVSRVHLGAHNHKGSQLRYIPHCCGVLN